MKKRDSFIFYRSFYESILELPEDNQKDLLLAIANYSLNFSEPNLDGLSRAIWILIKPQLDANNKRYQNGSKGGRPKTKPKPKNNQSETKPKANKNDNVNDNKNKELLLRQFKSFGLENGLDLDKVEDTFLNAWDYYEDLNWKNKNGKPIINLQSTIRKVWFKDLSKLKKEIKIDKIVLHCAMSVPAEMERLCKKHKVTEKYLKELYASTRQ